MTLSERLDVARREPCASTSDPRTGAPCVLPRGHAACHHGTLSAADYCAHTFGAEHGTPSTARGIVQSPFVRRARENRLPAKELAR